MPCKVPKQIIAPIHGIRTTVAYSVNGELEAHSCLYHVGIYMQNNNYNNNNNGGDAICSIIVLQCFGSRDV